MEIFLSTKKLEERQSDQDFRMYPEKVPNHKVTTTLSERLRLLIKKQ